MPRFPAIVIMLALCGPGVLAQGRISISGGRPAAGPMGVSGRRSTFGISVLRTGPRRHFGRSPFFFGDPYFYSDYYGPDEAEYAKPEPAPAPVPQVKNEPVPDAVMLELRGNQWVRVSNFGESSQLALNAGTPAKPQSVELPAVLVYRDGHTEEVNSYSIIGRVMYTKSDYWSSGSWTRTIQLADLDIPATLKQNEQRKVKFELPSGPDEVMIRP